MGLEGPGAVSRPGGYWCGGRSGLVVRQAEDAGAGPGGRPPSTFCFPGSCKLFRSRLGWAWMRGGLGAFASRLWGRTVRLAWGAPLGWGQPDPHHPLPHPRGAPLQPGVGQLPPSLGPRLAWPATALSPAVRTARM